MNISLLNTISNVPVVRTGSAAGGSAPGSTGAPVMTGTATVGQTLSTTNGTWSGSPSSFAYQWRRAGVDIPGATANSYLLVSADFGLAVDCVVTATNMFGSTAADSNNSAAVAWPAQTPLGQIFSADFSSLGNLNDFTVVSGTGTIALSGGALQLSGGNGLFTNHMYRNEGPRCLEKWKQTVVFTTPNPVITNSYGFSVGVLTTHNNASYGVSTACWMKLSGDGGTLGRFSRFCINGGAPTQDANGGSNGLLSNNTTYTLVVERNKNIIIFNLYVGVGTGGSLARAEFQSVFNITTNTTNSIAHNTGRFCLWNHGGSFPIHNWTVESAAQVNSPLVCVGDSNMYGMYAGANNVRYCEQAAVTRSLGFEILAGPGDTTTECESRTAEIIAMNPRIVYLNTPSNDVFLAQSWPAVYATLVTALKNAGIKVVHGIPVARDSVDIASTKTEIDSTYAADIRVDLYTLTKNAGNTGIQDALSSTDNVHLNAAGNNVCDDPLATALIGL